MFLRFLNLNNLVLFAVIAISLPFFFFGIFYPDEGYILHTGARLLDGEVMYRDFDFVYTPLSGWIAALSFFLFGQSIASARIAAFFISTMTLVTIYLIGQKGSARPYFIFFPLLLYISWGPAHINFLWPSMLAISLGIFACFLYYQKKSFNSVLVGVCVILSFLAKQNIGLLLFFCFFLLYVLERYLYKEKTSLSGVFQYIVGLFITLVGFFVFLFLQGSLSQFWESLFFNLFQKIIIEKTIDTPLIYGSGVYPILKFLFYISPVFISVPALLIGLKNRSRLIVLPVFTLSVYIAGIRPVTDYVHISPLLALSGFPLLPLFIFIRSNVLKGLIFIYALGVIIIGLYSPIFSYYYRWQEPIIRQKYFIDNKRVNIFVDRKYATEIPILISSINEVSAPGSYIYINYYAPMLYFLLDRKNPTRYDYLSANAITPTQQKEIVKILHDKNVRIVITHAIVKGDKSIPYLHIAENFKPTKIVNDLTIWRKM